MDKATDKTDGLLDKLFSAFDTLINTLIDFISNNSEVVVVIVIIMLFVVLMSGKSSTR